MFVINWLLSFIRNFFFYCGILGRQKEKSRFEKTGKNLYLCAVFCIFNFVEDTLVRKYSNKNLVFYSLIRIFVPKE